MDCWCDVLERDLILLFLKLGCRDGEGEIPMELKVNGDGRERILSTVQARKPMSDRQVTVDMLILQSIRRQRMG